MSKKRVIIIAAAGLVLILLFVGAILLLSRQKNTQITNKDQGLGKVNRVSFSPSASISARKQAAIGMIKDKVRAAPIETADFSLKIDPAAQDILITKKTSQADEAIQKWLTANKLPNVLSVVQLSYKEIASKVLTWLDKTRVFGDKLASPSKVGQYICNGGYAAGQYCEDKLVCNTFAPANDIGLYAVWARFKSYEANGDPITLAVLQKDLGTYSDMKSISAIQPQLWSFKLMYEVWKSPLITFEQKEKLRLIFDRIQHNPEVITPVETVANSKGAISEINIPLMQKGKYNEDDGAVIPNKLNIYAAFGSEYIYTYLFAKENAMDNPDQYLLTARGLFNNGVRSYIKYGLTGDDDVALLGVTALDMYNLTKNKQYLDFAAFIYDKHIAGLACEKMDSCATALYFTQALNKQSPDQGQISKIKDTIDTLYQNKFDFEGTDSYQLGVGAFYDLTMELKKNTLYNLMPNSLIVGVLSELKQQTK